MKKVEITQRLRHYLKYIGYYVLGVGIACVLGSFSMTYKIGIGVFISFVVCVLLLYWLHFKIGSSLLDSSVSKKVLSMLPVVTVSTALLALKIFVNESIPLGEHPLISERERVLNYFLYSIWTTVILWEFYYLLWSRLKTNEQQNPNHA